MISWTTYGTWLQGDERGYVRNGKVLRENKALENANRNNLKREAVRLNDQQRQIVREAILKEADSHGQQVYTLAVCSDHVHLVTNYVHTPIEKLVWAYKYATAADCTKTDLPGRYGRKDTIRDFVSTIKHYNKESSTYKDTMIYKYNVLVAM
jgi:REP element-mobilizing transposase RayT